MARFRRAERIRRRPEFQRVYKDGIRVHGRTLTLFLLPSGGPSGRLGVAATKKIGGAVERNRAKRLIREVFRRNKVSPGFDVVVVPKRELLGNSLAALELEFQQTLERAFRRRRTATPA
jgi:ribonuclease P protein component